MNEATASLVPENQRIRLKHFARWITPDPNFPREFVFDLAIMDLGDRRLRRALPLIEAGARLPLNALGRIASLYTDGLQRIENGYDPVLGASNLARILLKNPEIPKFAADGKPAKGTLKQLRRIWAPFRDYRGEEARTIYLTLRHWAQTAPESYSLVGQRAVDLILNFITDPFVAADLMREVVLRLQDTAKYARFEPVEVKTKQFLPKELREVRG
ncbi:MAG TPA: hypothetical protein ENJ85_03740 [Oceanithermus profundus]|uniref:Uncharacterized protein n=1 Tax=Oceanithermus profundus TaxID=187137 RepID=A0A7C5SQG9_9DEIN|nr:hypothetical protein [Oceanithermus profundus]